MELLHIERFMERLFSPSEHMQDIPQSFGSYCATTLHNGVCCTSYSIGCFKGQEHETPIISTL